jgi:hypothetical protein
MVHSTVSKVKHVLLLLLVVVVVVVVAAVVVVVVVVVVLMPPSWALFIALLKYKIQETRRFGD